jgi:hypothetical protein
MTRLTVKSAALAIAQEGGQGRVSMVQDPEATYNEAMDLAERLFTLDVKNERVVDITLSAAGWRYALSGVSALSGLAGINEFTPGESSMVDVTLPYSIASRQVTPLDPNVWRIQTGSDGVAYLELADVDGAVGDVLHLRFENKHVVHPTNAASTTIPSRYKQAFEVLTAANILTIAANKAAQNTGSSMLPTDSVDRRGQADMLRRQAAAMMSIYDRLMGKTPTVSSTSGGAAVAVAAQPAGAYREFDPIYSHPFGSLFHGRRRN